ncbi:hypothetical protein [Cecembia calidifontis]|uniref:Uncharacterized protein n=1 Tax=Cecembia calidifontis TaxID=1187080 RepID=A0A4Q7P787_9BACT|nr:hypothetical protein [Cecembia calidifontis]RZS95388.1 hypothetical protein BC751_0911 [Cecembia calidifontis]
MKTILNLVVSLLLLANIGGCDDDAGIQTCEGDNAQQVQTYYNDEFRDIPCSLQNINTNDKVVNLVIKTQADYEKYFICSFQPPVVDFDKYFILAGRYRHHQCAVFDSQQTLICENKLYYKVRMLEQICAAFTNVHYFAVIDRQYENLPVVFEVKFSN